MCLAVQCCSASPFARHYSASRCPSSSSNVACPGRQPRAPQYAPPGFWYFVQVIYLKRWLRTGDSFPVQGRKSQLNTGSCPVAGSLLETFPHEPLVRTQDGRPPLLILLLVNVLPASTSQGPPTLQHYHHTTCQILQVARGQTESLADEPSLGSLSYTVSVATTTTTLTSAPACRVVAHHHSSQTLRCQANFLTTSLHPDTLQ